MKFRADRAGKFTFYCATQCSTEKLHPLMNGTFIVEDERPPTNRLCQLTNNTFSDMKLNSFRLPIANTLQAAFGKSRGFGLRQPSGALDGGSKTSGHCRVPGRCRNA